jgi:hypothetical protein
MVAPTFFIEMFSAQASARPVEASELLGWSADGGAQATTKVRPRTGWQWQVEGVGSSGEEGWD